MDFKWANPRTKKPAKYYKTLILKMSKDRQKLKELEDKIVMDEIQPDNVAAAEFEEEEKAVHSTTPEKPQRNRSSPSLSLFASRKRSSMDSDTFSDEEMVSAEKKTSTPVNVEKMLQRVTVYGKHCAPTFLNSNGQVYTKRINPPTLLRTLYRAQIPEFFLGG
jgi:hypothetical protein